MDRQQLNPWSWQDQLGFSQGWRVDGAAALVVVSGQAAISAEGEPVGVGDFEAQVRQVFENLRAVVEQADATLDAVVKLTVFLTDIGRLRDYSRIEGEFFRGAQPASTAVGVAALARPELMVEVEALAVL